MSCTSSNMSLLKVQLVCCDVQIWVSQVLMANPTLLATIGGMLAGFAFRTTELSENASESTDMPITAPALWPAGDFGLQ